MKESYIENEYYELWIENGIIHTIYKPCLKLMNIEIARLGVRDRLKVSNGITRPIFVYLCNAVGIDQVSRTYLAKGDALKYLSANAILADNPIAKFWAGIYIRIDKPDIPTKIFTHREEAFVWLEQYK